MKAEIICIGSELLLGHVINTNASFLGKELSDIGISLHYVTTVGDNIERIVESFRIACERADVIITSGGLGPTEDDLTHECIARFFGIEMDYHQEIADRITEMFKSRGRKMVPSNLKQAELPKGSEVLNNPYGTAPGIILNKNNKTFITFPGVPSELKDMWFQTAKPYLISKNPEKSVIKSRILKFIGESESAIAENVSDFLSYSNPTVAPLAGSGEVVLRITSKEKDENTAIEKISVIETEILNRLGKFYYGADDDTLPEVTIKLLKEKSLTLSVAEGFTGASISQKLLSIENINKTLVTSVICPDLKSKIKMLEIENDFVDKNPEISSEFVEKMAEKIRLISGSDIGISVECVTELNQEIHPEKSGTIIAAVSTKNYNKSITLNYKGWKKDWILNLSGITALNYLRLNILGKV